MYPLNPFLFLLVFSLVHPRRCILVASVHVVIILRSTLSVGKGGICHYDVIEVDFGVRVFIVVRMEELRQLIIRLVDFIQGSSLSHAQHL